MSIWNGGSMETVRVTGSTYNATQLKSMLNATFQVCEDVIEDKDNALIVKLRNASFASIARQILDSKNIPHN